MWACVCVRVLEWFSPPTGVTDVVVTSTHSTPVWCKCTLETQDHVRNRFMWLCWRTWFNMKYMQFGPFKGLLLSSCANDLCGTLMLSDPWIPLVVVLVGYSGVFFFDSFGCFVPQSIVSELSFKKIINVTMSDVLDPPSAVFDLYSGCTCNKFNAAA